MAQHYLPEEVIADILKRLPVKSLLRFTCIEKSWYSLIHTSQFITLHSNHQKTLSDNNKHLSFYYTYSKSLSIRFDDEEYCEYYSPEFPSTFPLFHGVSNGLICFSSYKDMNEKVCFKYNIHIWNPAIRKYITLPPSIIDQDLFRLDEVFLAIGFLPKFNDYKVVKVETLRFWPCQKLFGSRYSVYSLSTNSWKRISHCHQSRKLWHYCKNMVFANGAVFEIVLDIEKSKKIIVCVDMENDVVCEIELPEHSSRLINCSLQVYCESLALFQLDSRLVTTMWIMEEGFSWKKKIRVSMDDSYIDDGYYWHITGMRNNGDLVLLRKQGDHLAFYNVEEERRKFVDTSNIWNRFGKQPIKVSPFMESLIGLNTFFNY